VLAEVYWILTTKNTLGFSAIILHLLEMLQVLVNKVHDLAQVVIYIPRDSGILYLKIRTFLQFSRVLMECYFLLNLFKNYPEFFQLEFYWLLIIKRYHPSSSAVTSVTCSLHLSMDLLILSGTCLKCSWFTYFPFSSQDNHHHISTLRILWTIIFVFLVIFLSIFFVSIMSYFAEFVVAGSVTD
jgi:hypothetical protein